MCRDDFNKFKQPVDKKLTNRYTIKETPALYPRFKIVGISERLSDDELIKCLHNQNKHKILSSSKLKVISWYLLRKK